MNLGGLSQKRPFTAWVTARHPPGVFQAGIPHPPARSLSAGDADRRGRARDAGAATRMVQPYRKARRAGVEAVPGKVTAITWLHPAARSPRNPLRPGLIGPDVVSGNVSRSHLMRAGAPGYSQRMTPFELLVQNLFICRLTVIRKNLIGDGLYIGFVNETDRSCQSAERGCADLKNL